MKIYIKNYSTTPGARFKQQGPFSAQEFLELVLINSIFSCYKKEEIVINLDGVEGYDVSFLEESFGGVFRKVTYQKLNVKFPEGIELNNEYFKWLKENIHFESKEFYSFLELAEKYRDKAYERI